MRIRHSFSSRRTRTIDSHNQHRKSFPALAREVIRISDIILYVLDARFMEETRNHQLEKMMKERNKIVITILNKSDLIDINHIKNLQEISELKPYLFLSCKKFLGIRKLKNQIKIEVKRLRNSNSLVSDKEAEEVSKDALMGHKRVVGKTQWLKLTKKAHVGVVGYPNTGKSSVIKSLTNRNASKASSQAGFTKGIQKIRFSRDILILDTPGVIEEKEKTRASDIEKYLKVGAKTTDSAKNPEIIADKILKEHQNQIESFYNIKTGGDVEILLESLGRKRGYLLKGNVVDTDRTAKLILKDWQNGNIARKKADTSQ